MVKLKLSADTLLSFSDPREIPTYGIPLAAHYLRIPAATVRSWILGRKYPTKSGDEFFQPLIKLATPELHLLSFYNLVEAHILGAFRREHSVPMPAIRKALDYVTERNHWDHPLIQQDFQTDGVGLFIESLEGQVVDASSCGQTMLDCVRERLQRVEWEGRLAAGLYPFTRLHLSESPRLVMIDPRHSFGQPFLVKSRIATAVVAERYKAGDSVDHLARDYECQREEIEEAIRCELNVSLAA